MFDAELARFAEEWGIHFQPGAYVMKEPERAPWKRNIQIAMDAQPALVSTSNAGIPSFLTMVVDPNIIKVLLTPNKAAQIFGEAKKGTWLDQTAMFPVIERTGEVSSYGDFNANGRAGLNMMFPQRQAYLYQIIKEYGELEMERAGLAKIGWAAEIDEAAVIVLNKFQNYSYFFGVLGLQNYGLLNDPALSAPITPATKAAGGNRWITAAGQINGTANEIFQDIQALVEQLVVQTAGLVELTDPMKLCMAPSVQVGLTATNQYNVNVSDLIKKNFPAMTVETAVQYGAVSATNPQGVAAGNLLQLIAGKVEGQDTGYCSFNEKLRSHPIVRDLSSFRQKVSQGTWGAIVRMPMAIASMVGV
jgi:hypothetical protein